MPEKKNEAATAQSAAPGHSAAVDAQAGQQAQKSGAQDKPGGKKQPQGSKPQGGKNNGPKGNRQAAPGKGPKGPGGAGPAAQSTIEVRPMAGQARTRRHHWGLLVSFIAIVLMPLAVAAFYLWSIAVDQYGSVTGFAVRGEESAGASDLLGGLAQFTTATTSGRDSDVLYEFIQSQDMVSRVDLRLDLRSHYARQWEADPVFALWPDATIEDLLWYWQRIVRISYDQSTGLIDLQVLAFDPDMAQSIATTIVEESQERINILNISAREDAMRYAQEDLGAAVARLKTAREALARFRTRTQIIDPKTDIEGRLGVLNNLQQKLVDALIEHDLLLETVSSQSDPRLRQARERIEVIRARIADERRTFASDGREVDQLDEDYPTLIAEFEGLNIDLNVAEETYRAALTALDVARANAVRQSRYLTTYIRPTRAESSEFPRREVLIGLAALFLLLIWGVIALIYYSIRDRS